MNLTELIQFYAPFAGLMALSAWVGALSERVRNLQASVKKLENEEPSGRDRMIRLETKMEGVETSIGSIDRSIQGINRQLANLANMKLGYAGAGMAD